MPFEWTNDSLQDGLAGGYHLRMDAAHIYLYFGYEDLVLVLPSHGRSKEQTSRSLATLMYRALFRRKALAPALEAVVTGSRHSSGRRC